MASQYKLGVLLSTLVMGVFAFAWYQHTYWSVPDERVPAIDSEMHMLRTQVEIYRKATGHYPSTAQGLDVLVRPPSTKGRIRTWRQLLREIPVDPWESAYVYRWPGTISPETFDLISYGPDGVESADDIKTPR